MHIDWTALWGAVWSFVSSDSAPAWVQAVGSIVALFVAIRLSRSSIAHAGLQKQKTIFSVAEAAHEYANGVRAAVDLIGDEPGSNITLYQVYHRDITAGLVRALQGAPVHELASSQQVMAILGIVNHLVFLGDAADKLLYAPSLLPGISEELESMDDLVTRRDYLSAITSSLKMNVLTQTDKIDEHYLSLKKSLDD
jgi:hypothetical protein